MNIALKVIRQKIILSCINIVINKKIHMTCSYLSLRHIIGFSLVLTLCVSCKKEYISSSQTQLPPEPISSNDGVTSATSGLFQFQTKTASRFNDWPKNAYVDAYVRGGAQYVAYDDNSYAYTGKISPGRSYASLLLQGFGFTLPSDATIENIIVSVRRFKKGKASIKDQFATLVKSPDGPGFYMPYGIHWTNPDKYTDTETEVIYSQRGTGSDGGPGNWLFQWTPDLINNPAFGVRIDAGTPVGGSVVVYYDQVQITVEYSTQEPDGGD